MVKDGAVVTPPDQSLTVLQAAPIRDQLHAAGI